MQAIDPSLREKALALGCKRTYKRISKASGEVLKEERGDAVSTELHRFGDLSFLAWHDLRLMLAESLPEGVLQTGMAFERYEEAAGENGGEGNDGFVNLRFCQLQPKAAKQEAVTVSARLLVGADGNNSAVRQQCLGDGPPEFLGTAMWRAFFPATPPFCDYPDSDSIQLQWLGERKALFLWGLPGGRLATLATSPWPAEKVDVLAEANYIQEPMGRAEQAQQAKQRCQAIFAASSGWDPEVVRIIDAIDPAYLTEHGQYCREPATCAEWGRGRVALLGDAAHLGTPFLGQGTSQAIEDALELGRAVLELGPTPAALRKYEQVRKPQATPVQAASVGLCKSFVAGKGGPGDEMKANIEGGFLARSFDPLPRGAEALPLASAAAPEASTSAGPAPVRAAAEAAAAPQVVLTREKGKNGKLQRELEARGISCLEMPLIETAAGPDRDRLPELLRTHSFDWICLTSPEAANVFLGAWRQAGRPGGLRLAVVGDGTGVVLTEAEGDALTPEFVPSAADAVHFSAELPHIPGGSNTVLYPASNKARSVLQDGLAARGYTVTRLDTYDTLPVTTLDPDMLAVAKKAQVITAASPSTIKSWVQFAGDHSQTDVAVACIGSTSATAAEKLGYTRIFFPKLPGIEGFVSSIEDALADCRRRQQQQQP
ncbi:hypothetical protein N2152v2_009650 [Parachlorella kessleri]